MLTLRPAPTTQRHPFPHSFPTCRNAFWPELNAEVPGWRPDELYLPDQIHPSRRGVHMLGGLVIDFLQNMTHIIETEGGSQQHVTPGSLPAPLYTNIRQDTASSECSRGDSLQDKAMYKLNWNWLEGKKPGWEADEDFATIFIAMDLPADKPPTHFSVGYLSSYKRTGLASVTCLGGCQCEQQNIRAHNEAQVRGPWHAVCLLTERASLAGGAASGQLLSRCRPGPGESTPFVSVQGCLPGWTLSASKTFAPPRGEQVLRQLPVRVKSQAALACRGRCQCKH